LQPEEEAGLLAAVDAEIARAAAVILSDYGKGVLAPALIAHVMRAAQARGIGVFVDPKSDDFRRYRGATCITPNLEELSLAAGLLVADEAGVELAARKVMADAEASAILATRSERGMVLVQRDGPSRSVPALAREVFDVSGAGETVIASLTLAYASGLSLEQSMHIANAAAGVVVSKLGTATATVGEVLQELERQDHASGHELPGLNSLAATKALVDRWRRQGLRVGFTNGCFDIIHPGHVALLKAARSACDRLVIALNTDASVSRLKGPTRPINDLQHRAQVIAAIQYVDCVVSFDEPTPLDLIQQLQPDVLVKGADWRLYDVVGVDVVHAAGGHVLLAKLVPGQSTTMVVERIRAAGQQPPA
jgi:D-beta-D-heptose 7-phosphate kinase/D-beta-D-heptose 1-phosphate adenosyltransferase